MKFRTAVENAGGRVQDAYCVGKQALADSHAQKVECGKANRISGSIDLDSALSDLPAYAQSPRWDYGLGYQPPTGREVAVWIEVHSASTGEVGAVLRKLAWLKSFLRNECEDLWQLTIAACDYREPYVWVASGAVHINKNSRQARQLSAAGVAWPKSKLRLP